MRDLPIIVAQLPVLSKAYYYESSRSRRRRWKPPLGSGPYKIKDFKPGTYITYTRREDYWAKDLPVNRGRYNFDEIRYDYYRDRNIELEALLSAAIRFSRGITRVAPGRPGYDIPAVTRRPTDYRGRCRINGPRVRKAISSIPAASKLKDPRVREALDLVFDFQWSNKKLFYEPLQAHHELLRKFGHEGHPANRAPKSWRCWSHSRTSFRQRCSANPIRLR